MSKLEEYKKSKRHAKEVQVVKGEDGSGFVTHTKYDPEMEAKGKTIESPRYERPEMRVHKTLSSVHSHLKDCMGV